MSVHCPDCGAMAGYGHEIGHRSTCPSLAPNPAARTLRSVEPPRDAINLLRLILPLAKGYAHEHPVGSNQQYVTDAEEFLARPPAVEPPREMVELAEQLLPCASGNCRDVTQYGLTHLMHAHDCPARFRRQAVTAFTALRSQTLDEAARKIKDEAESIMRDYVMTGPAGIVKGCIAAIRALPLPPGIK